MQTLSHPKTITFFIHKKILFSLDGRKIKAFIFIEKKKERERDREKEREKIEEILFVALVLRWKQREFSSNLEESYLVGM